MFRGTTPANGLPRGLDARGVLVRVYSQPGAGVARQSLSFRCFLRSHVLSIIGVIVAASRALDLT